MEDMNKVITEATEMIEAGKDVVVDLYPNGQAEIAEVATQAVSEGASVAETALTVVGIVLVGFGAGWLGKTVWDKRKAKKEQKKLDEEFAKKEAEDKATEQAAEEDKNTAGSSEE